MEINKIFLINLKRRPDRLLHFNENILSKLDINSNFEVIEAVDGRTIEYTKEMLKTINPWNIGHKKPKSPGVIGCCLSHLNIYKKLDYSDNAIYLIFEDDVMFAKNIDNPIKYVSNLTFPNDWGIIFLNNRFVRDSSPKDVVPILYNPPIQLTTESYLIKGSCAKELLDFNINNIGAIDEHIRQYFCNSKFKQYGVSPPIFKQKLSLGTDIQINRMKK